MANDLALLASPPSAASGFVAQGGQRTASVRSSAPVIVGRAPELRRIEEFAAGLGADTRPLVLAGEAGIGKTTLWTHAIGRCRQHGAQVLVTRPSEDDRHSPGQGLLDLLDARRLTGQLPEAFQRLGGDDEISVLDRSGLVLQGLRTLSARAPVVLAVDDLPWLDDLTVRVLRFCFRRLTDEPVTVLATIRTWSPGVATLPAPDLGVDADRLAVLELTEAELRRVVAAALPRADGTTAARISRLAHGNPMFALELARAGPTANAPSRGTLLAALARRISELPQACRTLAELLAVAGPSPIALLAEATGLDDLEPSLRRSVEAELVTLDDDFVLRFVHPLVATAVLDAIHPLDRQRLHAMLARVHTDPDSRVRHLARATVLPEPAVADQLEQAALRVARCGDPRLAAELWADSARLTPRRQVPERVRRTLGQMMQQAAAGDLPGALALSDRMLAELSPGPLRAAVVTGRVTLDSDGAEEFLRVAIADLPEVGDANGQRLRGRLIGLLGWLVGLHQGRLAEGLRYAEEALCLGRTHDDETLIVQAATAVSTISLLMGTRVQSLIDEACDRDGAVVRSELVLWPRTFRGRQRMWDGHVAEARHDLEGMYRSAMENGVEIQLCYRRCDLAQVELAAGELDRAARYVDEGMESALDCGDERAVCWLAYPFGMVGAWRGDEVAAGWGADRLDWWVAQAQELPRSAMASHIRGVLATANRDWVGALHHLDAALADLDERGISHPGAVPVLPLAVQVATLAGLPNRVDELVEQLRRQASGLGSPWAQTQLVAARAQRHLLHEPNAAALDRLAVAHATLRGLGHALDAARLGCALAAAGLRMGRRASVRPVLADSRTIFGRNKVAGWGTLADELMHRVDGSDGGTLTATEEQVAGLVAAGHRNREVADRLYVSESTVEAHLTRIYRKLGLRNRAELTRRVSPTPA